MKVGEKLGRRAQSKTMVGIYVDKDLKDTFKKLTEANKTCMADILVQAMQNYIKEHEYTLESK